MNQLRSILTDLKNQGIRKIKVEYESGSNGNPFIFITVEPKIDSELDELSQFKEIVHQALLPDWLNGQENSGKYTFDLKSMSVRQEHNTRPEVNIKSIYQWSLAKQDQILSCPEAYKTGPALDRHNYKKCEAFALRVLRLRRERSLLEFWLENPEVKSLYFNGEIIEDTSGHLVNAQLNSIEFISPEAERLLRNRLSIDESSEMDELDWQEEIFGEVPDTIEELCGRTLERPSDAITALHAVDVKLQQAIQSLIGRIHNIS